MLDRQIENCLILGVQWRYWPDTLIFSLALRLCTSSIAGEREEKCGEIHKTFFFGFAPEGQADYAPAINRESTVSKEKFEAFEKESVSLFFYGFINAFFHTLRVSCK